jgi:hypothetical protein
LSRWPHGRNEYRCPSHASTPSPGAFHARGRGGKSSAACSAPSPPRWRFQALHSLANRPASDATRTANAALVPDARSGKCRCRGRLRACGGKCFNLNTHPWHCGACFNFCDSPADTCCNGTCVNLDVDRDHCGACGRACDPGEICFFGVCQSCVEGYEPCGPASCPDCTPP